MDLYTIIAAIGVVLGLAGATFIFFSRYEYWIGAILFLFKRFGPALLLELIAIFDRMSLEEEEDLVAATRRGERDQWLKDRLRRRRRDRGR